MKAYIDSVEVYLDDEQRPAFTSSVDELNDPSKSKGQSSTTIRVIATKEARKVLGTHYMAQPEVTVDHILEIDGMYKAVIKVLSWNENVIECSAIAGNAHWFNYAKATVLNEVEYPTGPKVLPGNISFSWSDALDKLVYFPLVDYGAWTNLYPNNLTLLSPQFYAQDIRPGIRIGRLIQHVMRLGGWQVIPMGFRAQRDWYKWIHQGPTDKARVRGDLSTTSYDEDDNPLVYAFALYNSGTYQYDYPENGSRPNPIPFDQTTPASPPPPVGWDPFPNWMYTTQNDGGVYVSFDLDIPYTADSDYFGKVFRVVLWDETDMIELAHIDALPIPSTPNDGMEYTHNFTGEVSKLNVPQGHKVFIGITMNGSIPLDTFDWATNGNAEFNMDVDYAYGGTILTKDVVPKGSCGKLMQDIATYQGYVYNTIESQHVIEVWAQEDYYGVPGDPVYRDWRGRVDFTNSTKKLRPSLPRRLSYVFNTDTQDMDVSRNLRITNGRFGNAFVDIEQGYQDEKTITVPWSQTVMGYATTSVLMLPRMVKEDSVSPEVNYDIQPRILYDGGLTAGVFQINLSSYTNYPKCYFVLPGTDMVPLAFDNPILFEGEQPVIKNNQLRFTLDRMRFGKYLEAYVRLRDHEMQGFHHGIPTLLDDGSGAAWYYVQKIHDHQFKLGEPTKCTLVKIGGATEIGQSVVPLTPPPAFSCSGPDYGSMTTLNALGDLINTTTGYVALRDAATAVVYVFGTGSGDISFEVPYAGAFCLYSCDASGAASGSVRIIGDDDNSWAGLSIIDVTGYAATLQRLSINGGYLTALTGIELCTDLEFIYLTQTNFTAFDATPFVNATTLNMSASSYLTDVTISASGVMDNLILFGCALTDTSVNAILAALRASGVTGGGCQLTGGTNAAPTGTGITDKAYLIGTMGWTINTN